jgi:hypothetical protein
MGEQDILDEWVSCPMGLLTNKWWFSSLTFERAFSAPIKKPTLV